MFLSHAAFADEFMSIRNMEPTEGHPTEQVWLPGTVVVLPNGSVTLIEEELPSGELKTSNGTVITQDGKLKDTGKEIKLFRQDDLRIGARVKLPEGKEDIISEKLPDGTFRTKGGLLLAQDGKVVPQIKHVETFEEAEKFLPKTDKPHPEEKSAPKASVNSIEDLLAFNEAAEPKAEKPKTEKPKSQPTPFVAKKRRQADNTTRSRCQKGLFVSQRLLEVKVCNLL